MISKILALLTLFYSLSTPSAKALDRVGLIDFRGDEVIPCRYKSVKYLKQGFYLAEEWPDGASNAILSALKSDSLSDAFNSIENHELFAPKILLTRNGKRVHVQLPKDAYLTDVMLPPTESDYFQGTELRAAYSKNALSLPSDAVLFFVCRSGFGICDVRGRVFEVKKPSNKCVLSLDVYPDARRYVDDYVARFESKRAEWQVRYQKELEIITRQRKLPYRSESDTVVLNLRRFSREKESFSRFGKFVITNDLGQKISPSLEYVSGFSDGISLVATREKYFPAGTSRYPGDAYFIGKDGKQISSTYEMAAPFHGNYALVTLKGADKKEIGFVDRHFNYTFLCFGDRPYFYRNGCWVIMGRSTPTIVLDSNCKKLFETPEPVTSFGDVPFSFQSTKLDKLYFYSRYGEHFAEKSGVSDFWTARELPVVLRTGGAEWDGLHGVLGRDMSWIVTPQKANFQITESDRAVKIEYGKFNRECWLNQDDSRLREFYAFLREHKPIGMTKVQVEALLGSGKAQEGDSLTRRNLDIPPDPHVVSYQLNWFGAWCASSTWFAEFRYENETVKEWRIYKRTDRDASFWIRS